MILPLPFRPFDLDEPPLSDPARAARCHANKPKLPFVRPMGIHPPAIASFEPHGIALLAELSRVSFDDFCRNAAMRNGKRTSSEARPHMDWYGTSCRCPRRQTFRSCPLCWHRCLKRRIDKAFSPRALSMAANAPGFGRTKPRDRIIPTSKLFVAQA